MNFGKHGFYVCAASLPCTVHVAHNKHLAHQDMPIHAGITQQKYEHNTHVFVPLFLVLK